MFRRVSFPVVEKVIPLTLLIKRMAENTGDRTWGVDNNRYRLASTEHFGRPSNPDEYLLVKEDELKQSLYKDCTQAGHCMIYARNNEKIFGVYHPRASVLMQLRFDGYIGFPGGLVDSGEEIVDGLNRELFEELNLDLTKHKVTTDDYVISHYSSSKKICLHFYAMELSLNDLVEVERNAIFSKDYGIEVLGNVRVPLYTMGDGYRGFPVFLNNSFIGNSRNQLLHSLKYRNIMSESDIDKALIAKNTNGGIIKNSASQGEKRKV